MDGGGWDGKRLRLSWNYFWKNFDELLKFLVIAVKFSKAQDIFFLKFSHFSVHPHLSQVFSSKNKNQTQRAGKNIHNDIFHFIFLLFNTFLIETLLEPYFPYIWNNLICKQGKFEAQWEVAKKKKNWNDLQNMTINRFVQ